MQIELSRIDTPQLVDKEQEDRVKNLAESMKEIGLSHPVIIDKTGQLISGFARVRAAKLLGWETIEATVRDINGTEGEEIRLHENLRRENLPWWEQVILVERLHQLRQAKHGEAKDGRPSKDEGKVGWSIRDTARELQVGVGNLSEDLSLARALRRDSTLKNVKDKKTAVRLIRIAETRHRAELEATLPSNLEGDQVFFGDSTSVLSQLPANSIHHCCTDPPWLNFFDHTLRLDERTLPVFRELYRVLKHGAFLYLFCGLDDYAYYSGVDTPSGTIEGQIDHQAGELEKIGFKVSKTPLVWQKINSLSRRGVSSWEYDRDFEFITVAVKGNPALTTGRKLSSIKTYEIVHPSRMIHPNEKPVNIIRDILDDCSYAGQLIIDPFAGSGVVGEACKAMGRKYILIERDKGAYDKICERLK